MYRIVWSLEEATLSKAENKSARIHTCRSCGSAPGRHFGMTEKKEWSLVLHLANRA